MLLERVPAGLVTFTRPVVAPRGTVVVISVADTIVKVAAVPLKVTAVTPVRLLPSMMTFAPVLPDAGTVSTNLPSPISRLKIVPQGQNRRRDWFRQSTSCRKESRL